MLYVYLVHHLGQQPDEHHSVELVVDISIDLDSTKKRISHHDVYNCIFDYIKIFISTEGIQVHTLDERI